MSPIHFDRVQPGDLITAKFLNGILDQIERMQGEIDALTGGGAPDAPVITATIPATDIAELSTLQIIGRNFAVPAYLNRVSLDTTQLTGFLPGSSDTILNVAVPAGIPGLPKQMTLTVGTPKGSAHTTVQVVPGAPPIGGRPRITNVTTDLPVIRAGTSYTFTFQLDGVALTAAEQFVLSAAYSNADPAGSEGAWQAATSLVPAQDQITLQPGDPRTVGVRVTVPTVAKAVNLSLRARSVHNSPGSDGVSLPVPITVGEPGPNSDPSVTLRFGDIPEAAPMRVASIDGDEGLLVRYGRTVLVPIVAEWDATVTPATYAFSVSIENPGNLWALVGDPVPATFNAFPGADQTIRFNLQLKVAGAADEKRTLTVTATRQEAGGPGRTSFTSFPITGF
jgi:hypothetical protein